MHAGAGCRTELTAPWYPTARLFRQPEIGNWEAVIEQVRRALCAAIDGGDQDLPTRAKVQTASAPAVAPPDAP
jgi:hypothetical protein